MSNLSLFEQTLASDWQKLPMVIRRHYDIHSETTDRSCLQGKLCIDYPIWITPVIKIIHLFGGLIDQRGNDISTQVEKWISTDNNILHWHCSLSYPNGKQVTFSSRMIALKDRQLIAFVKYGFGLRLKIFEQNGQLVYKSNGHLWQMAGFCIIFPDWLLLGYATIFEQAPSEQSFRLDFEIRHPLWGVTYCYKGEFQYV